MPWYFAAFDGQSTHGYGVRTSPRAFCYWQADQGGVSLFADVRSGGAGVQLGERALEVCDVVCRQGRAGESPFAAIHALCREICQAPRNPPQPPYGTNDWYYAYGKNSAATILADARRIVDLSPADRNRPFAVIDDGWQRARGLVPGCDRNNAKFGMAEVGEYAAPARGQNLVRPLRKRPAARRPAPAPRPRVPRSDRPRRDTKTDDIAPGDWGFELVKHDYDVRLFGRWGFRWARYDQDGWTFASGPGRTTAEVVDDLYRAIRKAAGDDRAIIGCNTVSHLSAGVFDICRIGDDTSGTEWARTRRMGVNTLAFRGVQHDAFYAADADCVGVTRAIPWASNRQWLDLVARSGTALFVSLAPDAVGADETKDLRAAMARAARRQPLGEPLDWQHTTWPSRWRLIGEDTTFDWTDREP